VVDEPQRSSSVLGQPISRRAVLAGGVGLAGASLLDACTSSSKKGASHPAPAGLDQVEHVVFLMQENRSFDHYFGAYRGVRGYDDRPASGLGNFSQPWPGGAQANLLPFQLTSASAQLCAGNSSIPTHDWGPQHGSWAGGSNDKFVSVHVEKDNDGPEFGPLVMGNFARQQIPFYYALADAYTICDNYHCSVLGPTVPNRLYFMTGMLDPAGTHGGPILHTPGLTDAPHYVGAFSWQTMPEVLQDAGVSWKVYQQPGTSVGSSMSINLSIGFNVLLAFSQYVKDPSSPLYKNAFLPSWPDELAADVKSGTLPSVSWILPPIAYSEHPNGSPTAGAWFVSQVLQTLQSNPDVWAKTVLFVNYDENGGFFDHVAPPTAPTGTAGEEITAHPLPKDASGISGPIGLGFRVPMLVVSPFSAGGWVDSNVYDHTSTLRFLEARFGVHAPNLTSWRRNTVGDLTASLGFSAPSTAIPNLPATSQEVGAVCPSSANVAPFLLPPQPLSVPTQLQMPSQEPGSVRRR
jgi:phospholipase C